MEEKIQYIIITFGAFGDDISWYDTYEEAYEDYDPLTFDQQLLKVERILP